MPVKKKSKADKDSLNPPVKKPRLRPKPKNKLDLNKLNESELPQRARTSPKYTDPADVFDLIAVKGLSYSQAGKILGITASAICQLVDNHSIPSKNALEKFKNSRADLMASKSKMILDSLNEAEVQKASPYQRVGMYGILFDKERLERGQSTANIEQAGVFDVKISDLDKEIKRLQGELVEGNVEEGEVLDREIALLEDRLREEGEEKGVEKGEKEGEEWD